VTWTGAGDRLTSRVCAHAPPESGDTAMPESCGKVAWKAGTVTVEATYPPDGGVERIEAQTSEQLNVALEVSILFRLAGANVPDLYQRLGSERQIKSSIVLNAVRNGVRDAVATKSINDIFSPNRRSSGRMPRRLPPATTGSRVEPRTEGAEAACTST